MIVIYHDVGGAHSTVAAANIHIGKLPMDRVPDTKELISLPTFDKITKDELGHLIYIGKDEFNTKVYTLGRKYAPNIVIPAIQDMCSICNKDSKELLIIDTKPTVNFLMNVGGFTSRKLHLVSIGRPIVLKGTQQAYMDIVKLVQGVKSTLKLSIK
ncbi:DUF3189 family protein [Clostridium sp. JN-1]|jgi:hypothetical protein|uniref:DUF3189 family protein n=1 Tax=Clostridium sp. JN-1 TaxID=2483110 RepID=UPI000F0B17E0|nr:DUF3189 family protein [Clostridium sp. JN-1]